MIKGWYGSELPLSLPDSAELSCYEIDVMGHAVYHSSGIAGGYRQDPEMMTDDYGYEIAKEA